MSAWRVAIFIALCLVLMPWTPEAHAENLARIGSTAWPALPAGTAPRALILVDGHALAIDEGNSWLLAPGAAVWAAGNWQPPAGVVGAVSNASQAFLLTGAGTAVQQVLRLQLHNGQPSVRPLPPLPQPLMSSRGATTDDTLTLAGLDTAGQPQLWQLELGAPDAAWLKRPGWPSGSAPSAVLAQTRAIFVTTPGTLGDQLWRWSPDLGWTAKPDAPGKVRAGAVRALGQAHSLYLIDGAEGTSPRWITMHTITGAWSSLGDAAGAATAVLAMPWGQGVATAAPDGAVSVAQVESDQQLLRWLDWVVIVAYLVSMLGIGLYFYRREKRNSTSDFFVGGRSIPFWAAGVSLYAANTSSISYIAIPAKAFETNWQYMTNNLIAVLGLMFVAVWIVPLLRRLDLMSVFSYLETRFHPAIRMLASGLFMLTQLGSRMSVILFLPSLAIATITGIPVTWSIMLMGGFTIVYTALGGMKAVVWTDIVQLVVKMGGAIFAIAFIVWSLKGGMAEFISTAAADDKTKLFDFSFDLTKATVWGFIFLVLFDVVLTFPKDQVLMQRTLSTSSAKNAGRSIWAFAAIMIPGGIVFYSIGTALFVYYKANPERMNPLLSIDATFPLFIAAELPMGVTGLIIAGIFAAAMATLSSIINSVSTLASVDFYEKLVKHPDPARSVRFAEWMTVVAGLLGMGFALVLSRYDIHSLFDVSIELAGLLGGGFAGAYTLGMFTRRANSAGVAIGVACSIVLTTIAWWMKLVHPYFYLAISILLCIVIGYLASLFFPAPTRSLKGLTIYSDAD